MSDTSRPAHGSFAEGREATVIYARIRPRLQRMRLLIGVLLLAMTAVMWAIGESMGPLPPIAAGFMTLDAAMRLWKDRNPLWSFLVDGVAIGVIVASNDGILVPLAALLSYLLIGTVLLVRQPATIWAIGAAAASYSVSSIGRPWVEGADASLAAGAASWFQVGLLLAAGGTLLMRGADSIREARRRQDEALAAEKRASDMKTQFVSMISHELRTPLTNISGFADTLAETWRTLEPPEIDEFIAIIRTEAEHLGNLVDDVLAIPRLETGKLLVDITDFSLRPLAFRIADLVFPAGGEKEASVQVAGNVVLRADPNRVEQVLRNLLDNARKYGGPRVGIESHPRGDHHVIVVADNGQGVPEEARERIFQQFEQVSRGDARTDSGVGLGLSITRRLIEAMGGEVWYEPGFPVGARFCFSLPVGDAVATPAPGYEQQVSV